MIVSKFGHHIGYQAPWQCYHVLSTDPNYSHSAGTGLFSNNPDGIFLPTLLELAVLVVLVTLIVALVAAVVCLVISTQERLITLGMTTGPMFVVVVVVDMVLMVVPSLMLLNTPEASSIKF